MDHPVKVAKTFPIVGAHFRPPAKALCATLGQGSIVRLVPEPTNPYDAHAVAVWVHIGQIHDREELATLAAGYGYDLEQLDLGTTSSPFSDDPDGWWQLGYIPAVKAGKEGAPAVLTEEDYPINHIGQVDDEPGWCEARVTFDMSGKVCATVSPWPPSRGDAA